MPLPDGTPDPPSDAKPGTGGVSGTHPVTEPFDILLAPTLTGKETNRIREELVTVACWKLNDVRFLFGKSFILPQTRGEFLELLQLRKEHAGAPFSVFGHADPVNNDVFNKQLSGHRSEAVYAVLIRDAAMWEKLFKGGGQAEGWGLASIQHMLEALGFDPGPPTGVKNAQTTAAVKDFQSKNDLDDDGDPGPNTREK
ncbi:MAG: peptidoglycan-binding protein, partial [Bryobacteraceae bacterium]